MEKSLFFILFVVVLPLSLFIYIWTKSKEYEKEIESIKRERYEKDRRVSETDTERAEITEEIEE